ncbi:hypothetical protein SF23_12705, partial [Streptomyces sp. MBRL 10]
MPRAGSAGVGPDIGDEEVVPGAQLGFDGGPLGVRPGMCADLIEHHPIGGAAVLGPLSPTAQR